VTWTWITRYGYARTQRELEALDQWSYSTGLHPSLRLGRVNFSAANISASASRDCLLACFEVNAGLTGFGRITCIGIISVHIWTILDCNE